MKIEIEIPSGTPKYMYTAMTMEVKKIADINGDDFVEICTKHYDGHITQSIIVSSTLLPLLIEALQKIMGGKTTNEIEQNKKT